MSEDPWKHRSAGMRCRTCMFYVVKEGKPPEPVRLGAPGELDPGREALVAALAGPRLGRCRRHAPTLGGFPAVFENDWCGDHKLDETKL